MVAITDFGLSLSSRLPLSSFSVVGAGFQPSYDSNTQIGREWRFGHPAPLRRLKAIGQALPQSDLSRTTWPGP